MMTTTDDTVTVSPLADLAAVLPACLTLPGWPADGGRMVSCTCQRRGALPVPAWGPDVEPTSHSARVALIRHAWDIAHETVTR